MDSNSTLQWLESQKWTFAKTMPYNPHFWLAKKDVDADQFLDAVNFVESNGEDQAFGKRFYNVMYHNGYKYWTMGLETPERVTIINRTKSGLSIEPIHLYTNRDIRDQESVKYLKEAMGYYLANSEDQFVRFDVMIDNYSHGEKSKFGKDEVFALLKRMKIEPNSLIYESELIEVNFAVLSMLEICDKKAALELREYIAKKGKHPCSLFITSWYLMRTGKILALPQMRLKFKPSFGLINILHSDHDQSEQRAAKYIESMFPNLMSRIQNVYL